MKRINILAGLALLVFSLAGCATQIYSKPGTTTTVIMLRHAERTAITEMLTERGRENAKALVPVLGNMKIHAIYSPNLARNLDTVTPLANHLGIKITLWPEKGSALDAEAFSRQLIEKHSGQTVLWVGNTNNLPPLYYAFGGEGPAPDNYGDLFILTIPDKGRTTIQKRNWGKY